MPDDLGPDEMRSLWCNQPVQPVRLSPEELRRKAQALEAKFQRGIQIMSVLMIVAAAGYVCFLYFFPGTLHRIGASLTLAGYLYCAYQIRKRRFAARARADAAPETGASYRAELERQRDFSLSAWKMLMLPVVPGPAVFMMAFLIPEQGVFPAIAMTSALIASPFAMAIPLGRMKARKLEREIRALDALTQH